jgi:2-octaprenyl-6-methoxyphenol hydroxylase
LVGSSLACALESTGYRIVLVEAAPAPAATAGFDQRKLALAAHSLEALRQLGVLGLLATAPTPITRIHISRVGDFGRVLLKASDYGHDAFGAVVLAQELGTALAERVDALRHTTRICPATVAGLSNDAGGATLELKGPGGDRMLRARCVVAADGTNSFIRQACGIGSIEQDYRQTLFVCSVQAAKASDGTAFERFSSQGPVALLPMVDGRYGAVCGVADAQAEAIGRLSDAAFAGYLQSRFGWRVGKILQVGVRSRYPIRRMLAERLTAPSVFILGNAAQTIHPIGAQGFNLGLRDVLDLARILGDSGFSDAAATRYEASRVGDRARTLAFSDGLARLTANDGLPLHALRSFGLSLLGAAPALASELVGRAMGYRANDMYAEAL